MKNLYLIIILIFIGTVPCKAQLNELTQTEFFNIKFDDISLGKIYETTGNIGKMKVLFGNNLLSRANTTGPSIGRDFWNDSIYLNFEDESNTGNKYNLTNIQIENSSVSLVLKGVTVKLGDDVSVFGSDIVINTHNGDNSVVFTDQLTGSTGLAFKIDKITNKIIEITFNAY